MGYYKSCNKIDYGLNMIPSSNEITEIATDKIDLTKDKYTLDQNQIQKIAKKFMKEEIGFKMKATKTNENTSIYIGKNKENKRTDAFEFVGNNLSIERVKTVYDSANRPIAHIINFSPKGYCVMSATLKYNPVLSFSSENKFEEEKVSQPEALWWIEKFNLIVHLLNDTNYIIPPEVTNNWMFYGLSDTLVTFNKSLNNDINKTTFNVVKKTNTSNSECRTIEYIAWNSVLLSSSTDTIESVGPLMTTSWGQRGNYNNFCPNLNCGYVCDEVETISTSYDGEVVQSCIRSHYEQRDGERRAVVGCVAVAVGQLMKYWFRNCTSQDIWKSQSFWGVRNGQVNFNFRDMPNSINLYNPNDPNHVALNRFLADVGDGVSMNYGCNSSGANISRSFFSRNDFLIDAFCESYNFTTIKNAIRNNKPVYLSAYNGRSEQCFIFCWYNYSDEHAWVADGYRKINVTNSFVYIPEWRTFIRCGGSGNVELSIKNRSIINNSNKIANILNNPPESDPDPQPLPETTYASYTSTTEYIHHNWGWGYANYGADNWFIGENHQASRVYNFQYNKKMTIIRR